MTDMEHTGYILREGIFGLSRLDSMIGPDFYHFQHQVSFLSRMSLSITYKFFQFLFRYCKVPLSGDIHSNFFICRDGGQNKVITRTFHNIRLSSVLGKNTSLESVVPACSLVPSIFYWSRASGQALNRAL